MKMDTSSMPVAELTPWRLSTACSFLSSRVASLLPLAGLRRTVPLPPICAVAPPILAASFFLAAGGMVVAGKGGGEEGPGSGAPPRIFWRH